MITGTLIKMSEFGPRNYQRIFPSTKIFMEVQYSLTSINIREGVSINSEIRLSSYYLYNQKSFQILN